MMDNINQFFFTHLRAMLASLGELCRRPLASFMTSLVIALALCLPVALMMSLNFITAVTPQLDNSLKATIFLQPGLESNVIDRVLISVSNESVISRVEAIPPKSSLTTLFGNQLSAKDIAEVDPRVFPTLIEIQFKPSTAPEMISELQQKWEKIPEIESVTTDMAWFQRMQLLQSWGWRAFWVFMIGVGASVFLILVHVIRSSLTERRHEVEILKLFGATPSFIRRPFLYQGCWLGAWGALIATLILAGVYLYIGPMATQLAASFGLSVKPHWGWIDCVLTIFILGISIACLSSAWTVQRYLKSAV
jgi:cell division transport system permease protein